MRLIYTFDDEKEAVNFSSFLSKEGVENSIENEFDPVSKKPVFQLWILNEDDVKKTEQWLEEYKKDPKNSRFTPSLFVFSKKERQTEEEAEKEVMEGPLRQSRRPSHGFGLTIFLIMVCCALFLVDSVQEVKLAEQVPLAKEEPLITPLEQKLLFDFPKHAALLQQFFLSYPVKDKTELEHLPLVAQQEYKRAEETPYWEGIYPYLVPKKEAKPLKEGPLFEKIRQGEVWRLISPVILHRDFLHILFNMLWLWYLGRQVEPRLGKWRFLLISLIIGVIANLAQYFMSGPFFLGYSGIIVGLVGFIWMRQRKAPWEGYPLQRTIILFLLFFIVAMFALQIFGYFLEFWDVSNLSANIGNTAHITGGIVGLLLGRLSYFARKKA